MTSADFSRFVVLPFGQALRGVLRSFRNNNYSMRQTSSDKGNAFQSYTRYNYTNRSE